MTEQTKLDEFEQGWRERLVQQQAKGYMLLGAEAMLAAAFSELDRSRALLEPSPCGVDGHFAAHLIQQEPQPIEELVGEVSAEMASDAGEPAMRGQLIYETRWIEQEPRCSLCLTLERLRERAFRAGRIWQRSLDAITPGPMRHRIDGENGLEAQAIAAIPLQDGGEKP